MDNLVVTTGEEHLMTTEFCTAMGVKVAKHNLEGPHIPGVAAQGPAPERKCLESLRSCSRKHP